MTRNRFYLYPIICFFATALIFLVKLILEEPLMEVIQESVIGYLVILAYLILIFKMRKSAMESVLLKKIGEGNGHRKKLFWVIFILLKIIVTALVLRVTTLYFFDDDNSPIIGLPLLAIGIGSSLAVLLVYLLEGFMESEEKRVASMLNLKEYESEKAIANYNALKKQLNPHFLFNSFNSLAGLVSQHPKKSEQFIQELSNIYRYTLSKSDEVVVTLKDELQLIDSYILLQQIRFKDKLHLKTKVDSEALKRFVPPMSLELLVENAIKHNVIGKTNPLIIQIYTEGDYLVVGNTYNPKSSTSKAYSHGIGLKNLTNQYALISTKIPFFGILDGQYIAKIPLISTEV